MARSRADIAWAAGLFEGEGCVSSHTSASSYVGKHGRAYPSLDLAMTDRDVIEHFQQVMGFGSVYLKSTGRPRTATQGPRKDAWAWRTGKFEHVQAALAMFWPFLGERRRAKAKEVLKRANLPVGNRWDTEERRARG